MTQTRSPVATIIVYNLTGQNDFTVPFEYLARKYVALTLIGTSRRPLVMNSDYRFVSKTVVSLSIIPPAGFTQLEIRRNTSATERLVDFHDGSILRANDLNIAQIQSLHVAEEARSNVSDAISVDDNGNLDARGKRIVNLGYAQLDSDAVTLAQAKQLSEQGGTFALRQELGSEIGNTLVSGRIGYGYPTLPLKSKLDSIIDIMETGAVYDGVTNDGPALVSALSFKRPVTVSQTSRIILNSAQAAVVLQNLDLVSFLVPTQIEILAGEVALSKRVLLSNPTITNLSIKGADPLRFDATSATLSGSLKNFSCEFTVANTNGLYVGGYMLVSPSAGTGNWRAVTGCWKIVQVNANSVVVKMPFSWNIPDFTVTAAQLSLIDTVLRWPSNVVGMAITGNLKGLSNVVMSGSFDVTTGTFEDGACDGLQVGSSPNTPETGLNESEQTNTGSVYMANVGIVEWKHNGTQVFGRVYAVNSHVCSNGWRGWQAGRSGSIIAKRSGGSANGATGYEAEEGGFVLAHYAGCAGNNEQGAFSIGGGATVDMYSAHVVGNGTNGLDARNYATILADAVYLAGDKLNSISSIAGQVLVGAGANILGKVQCAEGGIVNAYGAATLAGTLTVNRYDGSRIIRIDGLVLDSETQRLKRQDGKEVVSSVTSAGDLAVALSGGTIVFKADGTILQPAGTALGRKGNGLAFIVLQSPGGTDYKVSVSDTGTLSAVAL